MAKLLLNFRGVPDDEIEDVRELLIQHGIKTYETKPSRWAVSAGGIWVADDAQYHQARILLDEYACRRSVMARDEYRRSVEEGRAPTLHDRIREDPLRFVFYLAAAGLILYFSIMPFVDLGK